MGSCNVLRFLNKGINESCHLNNNHVMCKYNQTGVNIITLVTSASHIKATAQ